MPNSSTRTLHTFTRAIKARRAAYLDRVLIRADTTKNDSLGPIAQYGESDASAAANDTTNRRVHTLPIKHHLNFATGSMVSGTTPLLVWPTRAAVSYRT